MAIIYDPTQGMVRSDDEPWTIWEIMWFEHMRDHNPDERDDTDYQELIESRPGCPCANPRPDGNKSW